MTAAYTLLLLLCLGPDCRTVRLPVDSLWACQIGAQQAAVEVMRPGERVARMRCEAGERA